MIGRLAEIRIHESHRPSFHSIDQLTGKTDVPELAEFIQSTRAANAEMISKVPPILPAEGMAKKNLV